MKKNLITAVLMTIATTVLLGILYPLLVTGLAQLIFPKQANGQLIQRDGLVVGSRLIGQPFTQDEYFQPRPSSAGSGNGYDASASSPSNWAANNYLLRDRVARALGPIVKYRSGSKKGQPVAPDIEAWFQKDQFGGKPGIVAQWAAMHSGVAGPWLHDWVKADKLQAAHVAAWVAANPDDVAKWKSENTADPKPEDLAAGIAGGFFASFSKDHPGTFPGIAEFEKDGKTAKTIGPVKEGSDIQSLFFDMWLQEHADVDLERVPADMVMASGSGLDPDITLANALWQLDRVAAAWAKKTGSTDEKGLHDQIERLLRDKSYAPLGRLVGVPLVNVLEVNLALRDRYQKPAEAAK